MEVPDLKVYRNTALVCGILLMIPSTYVIYKIYHGSKLTFSYTLMAFTIGYSISNIESWGSYAYGKNFPKVHESSNTIYFWLSIQNWIFACKYFESASKCAFSPKTMFTPSRI